MSIKIRILCGLLGIVGGVVWLFNYVLSMMELVVMEDVSGLPLHLMFKTTLAFWGLFFIGAIIGKKKIFIAVSSFTVIACITAAFSFISAAEQLSANLGNIASSLMGEHVEEYKVSYIREMKYFLPSIICGVLGLAAVLIFGKKTIVKKEIQEV